MDLGVTGSGFVVTGGSQGLGLATARALVADGARVLLVARGQSRLERAGQSLGAGAEILAADLALPDSGGAIAAAAAAAGMVDGLVVNVGGPEPGTSLAYTDEQWHAAIDGVLLASLRLVRACVPVLADASSVLFVLSTTVKEPIDALGASNVLRPGLAMLVKELAGQLAPRGIRVNGILPGRIATDRMTALTQGDPGALRAIEKTIPLGRLGEPDEFGRVAAFLLSPAASYVTGVLVPVDGGLLRSPW